MKRIAAVCVTGSLLALPLFGGIHYKSRTYQEGKAASKQMDMTVEGWVEGENAKIVFTDSKHPYMRKGTYLLTTDGGKTLFLVDLEKKTYGEWDVDAMLQLVGAVMSGGMGGVFKMEFSDPKVETLLEEEGGVIVGIPTTHYRFRTTYSMQTKVMGIKRGQEVESVQDIWSTDRIADSGMAVWLKKEPPKMGDSGLDQLIAAEMSKVKGFALKTIQESISTGKKGKQQVTRTITEVFELDEVPIDPRTWVIPADCQRTDMMPTPEAGERNPFANLGEGGKV